MQQEAWMTQIHISTAFPCLFFFSLCPKKTSLPSKCAYKLMLGAVICFGGLIHLHVSEHWPTEVT